MVVTIMIHSSTQRRFFRTLKDSGWFGQPAAKSYFSLTVVLPFPFSYCRLSSRGRISQLCFLALESPVQRFFFFFSNEELARESAVAFR